MKGIINRAEKKAISALMKEIKRREAVSLRRHLSSFTLHP